MWISPMKNDGTCGFHLWKMMKNADFTGNKWWDIMWYSDTYWKITSTFPQLRSIWFYSPAIPYDVVVRMQTYAKSS
jgi:hypothetical protein